MLILYNRRHAGGGAAHVCHQFTQATLEIGTLINSSSMRSTLRFIIPLIATCISC